jgi:alkylation response protein AidB-like acyl-CoA dehydrogenase
MLDSRLVNETETTQIERVLLGRADMQPGECTRVVLEAHPTNIDNALVLAMRLGVIARPPGTGSTRDLWEALATLASFDLGAARAVEPHLDALAILQQAGSPIPMDDADTWGVFAAEGGDRPVTAEKRPDGWRLSGMKPWCSLANRLACALVTAHLSDGGRGLFAVDLHRPGVTVLDGTWMARGLSEIPSGPIILEDVDALPIGNADWYLTRPGFAWGGIGVAACWYGGLVGIARTVYRGLGSSPAPLQAMLLGQLDGFVQSARRALVEAVAAIDEEDVDGGAIVAKRARQSVAESCEHAIGLAGHALGPAPLALDADHAKRVADLELYIRQHHAEKDDASLGTSLAATGTSPW